MKEKGLYPYPVVYWADKLAFRLLVVTSLVFVPLVVLIMTLTSKFTITLQINAALLSLLIGIITSSLVTYLFDMRACIRKNVEIEAIILRKRQQIYETSKDLCKYMIGMMLDIDSGLSRLSDQCNEHGMFPGVVKFSESDGEVFARNTCGYAYWFFALFVNRYYEDLDITDLQWFRLCNYFAKLKEQIADYSDFCVEIQHQIDYNLEYEIVNADTVEQSKKFCVFDYDGISLLINSLLDAVYLKNKDIAFQKIDAIGKRMFVVFKNDIYYKIDFDDVIKKSEMDSRDSVWFKNFVDLYR